jgi:hypothetical protein
MFKRISQLLAGCFLGICVLAGGSAFIYSSTMSLSDLAHFKGVVTQARLVGNPRKSFILTLEGLPIILERFHADQDYTTLLNSLVPGDTVVAYFVAPSAET